MYYKLSLSGVEEALELTKKALELTKKALELTLYSWKCSLKSKWFNILIK